MPAAIAIRLAGGLVALCLGAAAVIVVALLLSRTPGPVALPSLGAAPAAPASSAPAGTQSTPTAGSTAPTAPTGFPAPPPHTVVFSRADGANVLALAVAPGRSRLGLQASLWSGDGAAVP